MVKKMPELHDLPPLPEHGPTRNVYAEVDLALFTEVERELKNHPKLKIKEVVEWGMLAFLLKNNPKAAAKVNPYVIRKLGGG